MNAILAAVAIIFLVTVFMTPSKQVAVDHNLKTDCLLHGGELVQRLGHQDYECAVIKQIVPFFGR
jgi:hypothetical protein